MTIQRLAFIIAAAQMFAAGCSQHDPNVLPRSGLPTYRCRFADEPVKIDGRLDDPAWKDAPFSAEFVRRRWKVLEMPPNVHTRMKMLHDESNLYIAIECRDSDIWSTFTGRDDPAMINEEAAVIYVDPLGNGRDYYGFFINPLNAMLDLKRLSGSLEMRRKIWLECTRWNGRGIEHAVHVDGTVHDRNDVDKGWTLEISLPFETLGVRPQDGDSWRVQVGRIKRPRSSGIVFSFWSDARAFHVPRDFGVVVFQR